MVATGLGVVTSGSFRPARNARLRLSPFGSVLNNENGTELQRAPNAASAPVLLAERDRRRE